MCYKLRVTDRKRDKTIDAEESDTGSRRQGPSEDKLPGKQRSVLIEWSSGGRTAADPGEWAAGMTNESLLLIQVGIFPSSAYDPSAGEDHLSVAQEACETIAISAHSKL